MITANEVFSNDGGAVSLSAVAEPDRRARAEKSATLNVSNRRPFDRTFRISIIGNGENGWFLTFSFLTDGVNSEGGPAVDQEFPLTVTSTPIIDIGDRSMESVGSNPFTVVKDFVIAANKKSTWLMTWGAGTHNPPASSRIDFEFTITQISP